MTKQELEQLAIMKIGELRFAGKTGVLPRLGFYPISKRWYVDKKPTRHELCCRSCRTKIRKGDFRIGTLDYAYCLPCIAAAIWLKKNAPYSSLVKGCGQHRGKPDGSSNKYHIALAEAFEDELLDEITEL